MTTETHDPPQSVPAPLDMANSSDDTASSARGSRAETSPEPLGAPATVVAIASSAIDPGPSPAKLVARRAFRWAVTFLHHALRWFVSLLRPDLRIPGQRIRSLWAILFVLLVGAILIAPAGTFYQFRAYLSLTQLIGVALSAFAALGLLAFLAQQAQRLLDSPKEPIDLGGRLSSESEDARIEFEVVRTIIGNRATLIETGIERLGKATGLDDNTAQHDRLIRMVATDLFVEKAQRFLTQRADRLFVYGHFTLATSVAMLVTGAVVAYTFLHSPPPSELNGFLLTLRLFQASAFATFVLLSVYVLSAFSRAFYHEGTKLRERRHALRFGRLYMFLKADELKIDEIDKAFDWNRDTTTAFQQIKDVSPDTLQSKLLSAPSEFAKAVQAIVQSAKKENNGEEKEQKADGASSDGK